MVYIIPVEKNQEYVINIEATSSEGNGIGRVSGYTIFVPQTIKGDVARILVVKVKSSYGYGKILEIITPSTDRTVPICENFDKCGGCQIMNMSYNAQLQFKEDIVKNNLMRLGGFKDIRVSPIVGMDNPYEYRNKMIFPVGEDNGLVCGFYAQNSHRIVPISQCHLGDKINTDIIKRVLDYMKTCGVSAYDENTNKGLVRRIFTRKGYKSGQVMVVISINGKQLPEKEVLIESLKSVSDNIVSIILNVNTRKTNLVLGEQNITVWGREAIEDTLCELNYTISPHSFYQVNPIQTEKLYAKAIEFASLTGKETVMDIYCGIGTISLCCAKSAKSVIGVEIVENAILDARENAKKNNIQNASFYVDSAENIVPVLIEKGVRPDVVILDPPRKGSDEKTLDAIASAMPQKIVYVSCNSATLARDVRYLADRGYALKEVAPFDLFPHTVHVETVCLMSRKEK